MTNIMGYTYNAEPDTSRQLSLDLGLETLNKNFAVVVSDGLGSSGAEVSQGHQKVFPIGRNFLLGTGDGGKIQFVAQELRDQGKLGPKELSDAVMSIAREYLRFQPGEELNFLVCGPNGNTFDLYTLFTNRITKAQLTDSAVDGSGAYFVAKAIQRDRERGLSDLATPNLSIAHVTAHLFDLGMAATKSSGVNEQLQYGFMLPEGSAVLYHPQVGLTQPNKEYCDEKGNVDPRKVEDNRRFYWDLTDRLNQVRKHQWDFNWYSTALQNGNPTVSFAEAKEAMKERAETLARLRTEVNKMIRSYVAHYNPK
jgi:hypothetical protein